MDNVMDNGSRWRTLIGLVSMVAGALFLVASIPARADAGPGGPPGNNGTVKIDGVEFDSHPDNEPHVGCTFQVDFYGYDEGDLFADVTFEVQPPTGNEVILEDKDIFIGEDDNSGGGSEAGLDASKTYDLTSVLAGFTPHPQQGFHIKLTVNADGSQGADVKHKVFWVTGCQPPTTSSSTTSTSSSSTTSTTEHPTSSTESTTSTTEPTSSTESTTSTTEEPTSTTSTTEHATSSTTEESTTSSTEHATSSTTEKPTSTTESTTSTTERPTSSTASTTTSSMPGSTTTTMVAGGHLPDTGSNSAGLLALAGLALLLGGAALFASTKVSGSPS